MKDGYPQCFLNLPNCETHLKPLLKCQFPATCPCKFSSFAQDVGLCFGPESPVRHKLEKHCFIQCGQQATHFPQSNTHQGPHQLVLGFPPVEPSVASGFSATVFEAVTTELSWPLYERGQKQSSISLQ